MLKVKAQDLQLAMASSDGGVVSYLDTQSGAVIMLPEDTDLPADRDLLRACKRSPQRYRRVQPMASHDAFFLMEQWVARLPAAAPRRELERALAGKKPFAAFERVLCDYPADREAWFAQQQEDLAYFAYRWLKQESIEAELV